MTPPTDPQQGWKPDMEGLRRVMPSLRAELECPTCRVQRGYCAEHRPGPTPRHSHTARCLDPVRAAADCDVDDLRLAIKEGGS